MSKIIPYHYGTIRDGKIVFFNGRQVIEYCLKFEGKQIQVTIEKRTRSRTKKQNSTWHGVVCRIVADWQGSTIEDACTDLKQRLGYCRTERNKLGQPTTRCQSTAAMESYEVAELIDKAIALMARDYQVIIPLEDLKQ